MYYRSRTGGRRDAAAYAPGRRMEMMRMHSPQDTTLLREMTSWPPSWKHDVTSEIIYLKNNSAKFHRNPIWNDGVLGFLWRGHPNKKNNNKKKNKRSSDMRSVPGPKMIIKYILSKITIC